MNINLKGRVSGRYRLTAIRPDGTERKLTDWFDNLVLDAGLNRIGTGGVATHCQVGSGSTPPTVTDTSLESHVAGVVNAINTVAGNSGVSPRYGFQRMTYRFNAGVAAGNLSEVGVGWGLTGATLFSRALIRDGNGDPTTITVLGDEVLDVVYELRLYVPEEDVVFQVTIGGVTHDCVLRASEANGSNWQGSFLPIYGATQSAISVSTYAGPIGTILQSPSGAGAGGGSTVMTAYSNNSLEIAGTVTYGLTAGNVAGGIGAIKMQTPYLGDYQCSFDPKIAKDNTKVLTLSVGMSWARKTI